MSNVWIDRFTSLTRDDVRRLSAFQPKPLTGLRKMHYSDAAGLLDVAGRDLFVPTHQNVELMLSWLAIAGGHCRRTYPDSRTIRAAFQSGATVFPSYLPRCLTGLAGTGKTSLFEAFNRILSARTMINLGAGFQDYALQATVYVKMQKALSKTQFLKAFLEAISPDSAELAVKNLLRELLLKMHRYGVGFAISDEFQHASGSAVANTIATQLLLQKTSFCVPNLFATNFSMCHKLLRRPQEDRDRLFSNVTVIEPDAIKSQDWIDTVEGYLNIIPEESEGLQLTEVADYLYPRTFGLKRQLALLLRIAYIVMHRSGDKRIHPAHIDQAYKSREYSAARDDVEILQRQAAIRHCLKKDLWCPFQGSANTSATAGDSTKATFTYSVARAMVDSTVNAGQQDDEGQPKTPRAGRAYKARQSAVSDNDNVVPIKGTLADQFEAGMAEIRDGLKPKR